MKIETTIPDKYAERLKETGARVERDRVPEVLVTIQLTFRGPYYDPVSLGRVIQAVLETEGARTWNVSVQPYTPEDE